MRFLGRRLFLLVLLGLAHGCKEKPPEVLQGDGVATTETREIGGFVRLAVGSRIEAHVTIGDASKLEFRGDKNLLPHVTSKVEGGTLKLDTDVKVKPNIPLAVQLSVPRLDAVSAVKGAVVIIEKLNAQAFEARAGGGAKIRASGSAQSLVLEGAEAGSFDFTNVPVQSATVRLKKAARAEIGYSEKLDAKLEGVTRLTYGGTPEIKQEIHGRSRLVSRDKR